MFALVLAGELVFSLPYHITRYYRPTVLAVFNVTNAELGDAFAPYGVLAMLSYFPGGLLADRYSARKLMACGLLATAAGGLYLLTLPGLVGLSVLYAYWGVTSILPFWAAMIRATRAWGGDLEQGRGFGMLDGGRGLVGGLSALCGVLVLRAGIGGEPELANAAQRAAALQGVIGFYTIATALAAVVVWYCLPDPSAESPVRRAREWPDFAAVFRIRPVWLIAVLVCCAYCGYKGIDFYSLYAFDVLGMDEVHAAGLAAMATTYVRPVAAISAGFLGDRFGVAQMTATMFASISFCWIVLSLLNVSPTIQIAIFGSLFVTVFGAYALRGLYFALLQQTHTPHALTGAAVGLISLFGYTPDIYFSPIMGRLIDASPGLVGHQNGFRLLAGCSAIGLLVTYMLIRGIRSKRQPQDEPA